jgi:23S rRNA pseudouridine1911/1915/1917 synthase
MEPSMSDTAGQERIIGELRPDAVPPMPPVLYEDNHLLAVNKPAGLVTHPTYKHHDGTLTDAVFARQVARGEPRPCLLHRLDRQTTGVVLFAKTAEARRPLVRQFERRTVRKQYLALAAGLPANLSGVVEAPLRRDPLDRRRVIVADDGEWAVTRYEVLALSDQHALVLAEPKTGRTHQIRAHLAHLGAPLAGDTTYGGEGTVATRAMLHAWRVQLWHPIADEPLIIAAPIPADFVETARRLAIDAGFETLSDKGHCRGETYLAQSPLPSDIL